MPDIVQLYHATDKIELTKTYEYGHSMIDRGKMCTFIGPCRPLARQIF